MDVQAEKRVLMEQLARLQDVSVLQKIKDLLKGTKEKAAGYQPNGDVITQSDLIARAEESNKAIKEGRTKSLSQLREEIKSW